MKRIWQRLSDREKKLVALTFVVVLLVLGRYFLVTPFLERREWVESQLEIQPQLLAKNLRYIDQKEEIAAALEAARNELKAAEPILLTGDTPSVSASDLQHTVQALATREGTQVITTRVLNPEPAGSFTKIPIQMEISGQIDQIANLIKGIESAPKLLVVNEINVRSLFRPIGVPQRQPTPQIPVQNLRVSLVVAGFARAPSSPAVKSEEPPAKSKSDEGKAPSSSPSVKKIT